MVAGHHRAAAAPEGRWDSHPPNAVTMPSHTPPPRSAERCTLHFQGI